MSAKKKASKKPKEPKKRPTPAFDKAVAKLTKLRKSAQSLSPTKVRALLRTSRNVSRKVWTRAVREVFGGGVLELPDFRQLGLFGGVNGRP